MRTIRYLCAVLACAAGVARCFNPGVLVDIHEDQFPQLVASILPLVNRHSKGIEVDESIHEDMITVNKMIVSVADLRPEQLEFDFLSDPGAILIKMHSVSQSVLSFVDISKSFFRTSGTVTSDGVVDLITVRMTFRDFDADHTGRPYFSLKVKELQFDKGSFHLSADLKNIPDFLVDAIIKLFKNRVLDQIKDTILKVIDKRGDAIIDKTVDKMYPLAVPLAQADLSLSTALVAKPYLDAGHLYVPVDGTFFVTSKGYSRTKDAEPIDIRSHDPFYLDVYVTQYAANSLLAALYDNEVLYSLFGFELFVDAEDNEDNLVIDDGTLSIGQFQSKVGIRKDGFFLAALSSLQFSTGFKIEKEDDGFYALIEVGGFTFESFEIQSSVPGIDGLSEFVEMLIQTFIRYQKSFHLKLPDIALPENLKIKDIGADLFKSHIRLSLSLQE